MNARLIPLATWAVRQVRGLGWAGAVGLALLAFAAAFGFSAGVPARKQLVEAVNGLDELRDQLKRRQAPAPGPRQRTDAFYARFPAQSDLPDVLLRLHGYALARGVMSQRADYREAPETGTPLTRVLVTLPVKGRYPQLRAWLADISTEMPQVGLEELRFTREDIGKVDLDAEVRFVVFLRRPS